MSTASTDARKHRVPFRVGGKLKLAPVIKRHDEDEHLRSALALVEHMLRAYRLRVEVSSDRGRMMDGREGVMPSHAVAVSFEWPDDKGEPWATRRAVSAISAWRVTGRLRGGDTLDNIACELVADLEAKIPEAHRVPLRYPLR